MQNTLKTNFNFLKYITKLDRKQDTSVIKRTLMKGVFEG